MVVAIHLALIYPTNPQLVAVVGRNKAIPAFYPPWSRSLLAMERAGFGIGHVAIGLFFLVSGFVIPFTLANHDIGAFTVRRIMRIYPTAAVCIAITLTALVLNSHLGGLPVTHDAKTLVSNFTLTVPYARTGWFENSAWTLALEELFYVLAALLSWRRLLTNPVAIVLLAIGASLIAVRPVEFGSPNYWISYHFAFIPFVFVGTCIHHAYQRIWSRSRATVVVLALVAAFAVAQFGGPTDQQAKLFFLSMATAIVVFLALIQAGSRLPYSRVLDRLSNITYPMYLLHFTNSVVVIALLQRQGVSYYTALPIAFALVVVGAAVVHRVIEEPSIRVGKRLSSRIEARTRNGAEETLGAAS